MELRSEAFNYIATNAWLPDNWIIFTGRRGETQTLWKIQLGNDGKTLGNAVRATSDAQGDYAASYSAGKLVFSRTRVGMNFWALPLDRSGKRMTAAPVPLTSTALRKGQQSVARGKLLYSAENGDRFSLFLINARKSEADHTFLRDGFFSLLAPDGSEYIYGEGTKEQLSVRVKSLNWWSIWSSTMCEHCGMPRQFMPNGRQLLLWSDSPPVRRLDLLDLATHKLQPVMSATVDIKGPRISSDSRWISFVAEVAENQWQAFVIPVSEQKPVAVSDWVPVTPVSNSFFLAFWSSQNDLIYTLSSHGLGGNLRFLDAHELDSNTKYPLGAATPVYEFEESLVPGMDPIWNNVSVEDDRIVLELGGVSSDIWIK